MAALAMGALMAPIPSAAGEAWEQTPGYGVTDYFNLDSPEGLGIANSGKALAMPQFSARFLGRDLEVAAMGVAAITGSKLRLSLRDIQGREWAFASPLAGPEGAYRMRLPGLGNGIYYLHIQTRDNGNAVLILPRVTASP